MHTCFSRGRSGGLVFPSLSEFSTVYCDPHSQRLQPINSTSRYIPNRFENKYSYTKAIVALFTKAKKWKPPESQSMDELINNCGINIQWNIIFHKNDVLIQGIGWMNLENMLNERSQTEKVHIIWFHLHEIFRMGKCTETRARRGNRLTTV